MTAAGALSRLMRLRVVEALAPFAGAIAALAQRLSGRPAGLIVLFHLVSDRQGDSGRELVAPLARELYERQLRHLRRHYEIVPLEALSAAVAGRRRGQKHPVSVTFDDDEPGHAIHALPALRAEAVPATLLPLGHMARSG